MLKINIKKLPPLTNLARHLHLYDRKQFNVNVNKFKGGVEMGRKGFTLVEIMIVVAIIALLAAIAIPNLLRARHNANEAAAQATLKTISTAMESYRAAQTPPAYPAAMSNLTAAGGASPAYVDDAVDTATTGSPRQGYNFTYTKISNDQYVCDAVPATAGVSGTRSFAVNESGVVRADTAGAACTTEAAYSALPVIQ